MSEFYEGYAEILEIPQSTISPKFDLTEHNGDSLAIISSTALIDDCFGVVLTGPALGRCQTVADLHSLVKNHRAA